MFKKFKPSKKTELKREIKRLTYDIENVYTTPGHAVARNWALSKIEVAKKKLSLLNK